jgi:hypothetical protein
VRATREIHTSFPFSSDLDIDGVSRDTWPKQRSGG